MLAVIPWTTIATAAVGVAGIGGTILATWMASKSGTANLRISISAENVRGRLAEKRRIYARCMGATSDMWTALIELKKHEDAGTTAPGISTFRSEYANAAAAAMSATAAVELIAPEKISRQAFQLVLAVTRISDEEHDDYWKRALPLVRDMRVDLGETAEPDEATAKEWLKVLGQSTSQREGEGA
jgi:hypothetical protein